MEGASRVSCYPFSLPAYHSDMVHSAESTKNPWQTERWEHLVTSKLQKIRNRGSLSLSALLNGLASISSFMLATAALFSLPWL